MVIIDLILKGKPTVRVREKRKKEGNYKEMKQPETNVPTLLNRAKIVNGHRQMKVNVFRHTPLVMLMVSTYIKKKI